eukprot:NODE_32_length_32166_cov_0.707737.p8 type:complete len:259 gc:universal NODE_32_length_32166_cov_0.707737:24935-24159(-)
MMFAGFAYADWPRLIGWKFTQISVSSSTVCGIDNSSVLNCAPIDGTTYTKKSGSFKTISITDKGKSVRACGVTKDDTITCTWDISPGAPKWLPVAVLENTTPTAIDIYTDKETDVDSFCYVTSDGRIICRDSKTEWADISDRHTFSKVSINGVGACAIGTDGQIYCTKSILEPAWTLLAYEGMTFTSLDLFGGVVCGISDIKGEFYCSKSMEGPWKLNEQPIGQEKTLRGIALNADARYLIDSNYRVYRRSMADAKSS